MGQIRNRATLDLGLLLKKTVAFTELAQIRGLRFCLTWLLASPEFCLTHQFAESFDMDAEFLRDQRNRHVWVAVFRHPDCMLSGLFREQLGHHAAVPSQPTHVALFDVANPATDSNRKSCVYREELPTRDRNVDRLPLLTGSFVRSLCLIEAGRLRANHQLRIRPSRRNVKHLCFMKEP